MLFAFSDSSGHYLIGGEEALSQGTYYLVSAAGDTVHLQQMGYRKESDQGTGRQTASNFQNEGGNVFFISSRTLAPDQTYLIVSSRFLLDHHPLRVMAAHYSPIERPAVERIVRERKRAVSQSWHAASLDTVGEIALVVFDPKHGDPLASLVVAAHSQLIFEDYPGDPAQEGSVWRVDDGGAFDARAIRVIAAFRSAGGIELARTWAGAEGENEEFLRQSSDRFVSVLKDYRYWVPE